MGYVIRRRTIEQGSSIENARPTTVHRTRRGRIREKGSLRQRKGRVERVVAANNAATTEHETAMRRPARRERAAAQQPATEGCQLLHNPLISMPRRTLSFEVAIEKNPSALASLIRSRGHPVGTLPRYTGLR